MKLMLILTGVISGAVTGVAMGGGTLLILILTEFMNVQQHTAQATNLIFFIPTSIVAIIIHFKDKNINKKLLIKMLPLAIIGTCIGSYLTRLFDDESLKKYFGGFLLLIGIFEIFTTIKNRKNEKTNKNEMKERSEENEKFNNGGIYRRNTWWHGRDGSK